MKTILKSWTVILKQNSAAALTAVSLIILVDISFFQIQSDLLILGILGQYILVLWFFNLSSKATFSFCFFILGILLFEFVFTGASVHTEKAAVWLFLFMTTGIIQALLLSKR